MARLQPRPRARREPQLSATNLCLIALSALLALAGFAFLAVLVAFTMWDDLFGDYGDKDR